ncbi:PWWP domain [Dillenia turbinata]|uniref:PWWP domain n=1 Tax=Dillenia turbinata TaxID=194707 RepID=A0AAN8W8C6_9MAGN
MSTCSENMGLNPAAEPKTLDPKSINVSTALEIPNPVKVSMTKTLADGITPRTSNFGNLLKLSADDGVMDDDCENKEGGFKGIIGSRVGEGLVDEEQNLNTLVEVSTRYDGRNGYLGSDSMENGVNVVSELGICVGNGGNVESRDGFSNGCKSLLVSHFMDVNVCRNSDIASLTGKGNRENEYPNGVKDDRTKSLSKGLGKGHEICVSDLVWGKVRSHPWWPGQIIDPADASRKALRCRKDESYLVAYFWDNTFAWNKASRLKPFRMHFSDMERQTSLEAFCNAVDCTLDEISRRVEFGLACHCISEDVYAEIKTQIFANSGIKKESRRRDGGDRFSSADSFEPAKLVDFMQTFAQSPNSACDTLNLVIAKAQVLSFYRWKGCPHLPYFPSFAGLLEDDVVIPVGLMKDCTESVECATCDDDEPVPTAKGKVGRKRKHILGNSASPNKKERSLSLSDLMMQNGSDVSVAVCESKGEDERKQAKVADHVHDDEILKKGKPHTSLGSIDTAKRAIRIGESIRRIANQLTALTPAPLKQRAGVSQKDICDGKSQNGRDTPGVISSIRISKRGRKPNFMKCPPDELLLQLCLVATDPMEKYNFLDPVRRFFMCFRNSTSSKDFALERLGESPEKVSGNELAKKSAETSELEDMKDSNWIGRIVVKGVPEDQSLFDVDDGGGNSQLYALGDKTMLPDESEMNDQSNLNLGLKDLTADADVVMNGEKPVNKTDETFQEAASPTALILSFTDLDSVPSIENLNLIFRRYGPLNESETEVLKKSSRAKVVFKSRADAETAFSSTGKFGIFGPSLVSYRLKFAFSRQRKASSCAAKRGRQ